MIFDHSSSFKFKFGFDKSMYIEYMNLTYISDIHYLSIWFSKQLNQTKSNKRIKLTD